jgi:hypothetical protein
MRKPGARPDRGIDPVLSMDTNILFAAVEVSNASHEAAAAFLESADARDDIATLATL